MPGTGKRDALTGRWAGAFLLAAVAAVWLAAADFALIDRLQYVSSGEQAVSSGRELAQTFSTPGDSIARIDLVIVQTPEGPDNRLALRLVAADTATGGTAPAGGDTLAEASLDMGDFDYSAIRRLEFDPVPVVPGELYAFVLTSDAGAADPLETGANPRDEYAGGSLHVNGEPVEGDLYFAVFREAGAAGMLERVEPWRPFLLGSPLLVGALLLAGAGAFGWLLRELVTSPGNIDAADCDR